MLLLQLVFISGSATLTQKHERQEWCGSTRKSVFRGEAGKGWYSITNHGLNHPCIRTTELEYTNMDKGEACHR